METRETKDRIYSIKIRQDRQLGIMRNILKEQRQTNKLLKKMYDMMVEEQRQRMIKQ